MQLRDLPPRKDPKGGSPRTPKPIPKRTMQINGYKIDVGVWIRFSVQVLLIIVGVLGVFFKLDNRVDNNEKAIELGRQERAAILSQIATIDTNGTHRSHEVDTAQQTQIDETIRRVGSIEAVLRDLVPKVERIDTNVLVLMSREKKM